MKLTLNVDLFNAIQKADKNGITKAQRKNDFKEVVKVRLKIQDSILHMQLCNGVNLIEKKFDTDFECDEEGCFIFPTGLKLAKKSSEKVVFDFEKEYLTVLLNGETYEFNDITVENDYPIQMNTFWNDDLSHNEKDFLWVDVKHLINALTACSSLGYEYIAIEKTDDENKPIRMLNPFDTNSSKTVLMGIRHKTENSYWRENDI